MSSNAPSAPSATPGASPTVKDNPWMRKFSKFLVFFTLFLIFMGGQVKSHEAGLSVPDWPLTYGHNPITYPLDQWVGGIFWEHTHRLIAGVVATLTILLAVWMWLREPRKWLRNLGVFAAVAVLVQAVLGGMTVWYQLPILVSSAHGMLAQTFLVVTVIIAYSLSLERRARKAQLSGSASETSTPLHRGSLVLIGFLYLQLLLGALTRHSEAGLAIPDFPTTAGNWIPRFNQETLDWINRWRADNTDAAGNVLDPVMMPQVLVHFGHRLGAVLVVATIFYLTIRSLKFEASHPRLLTLTYLLCGTVFAQFVLGLTIILTMRSPFVTSLHVATGAATLALAALLALRAWPLRAEGAHAHRD